MDYERIKEAAHNYLPDMISFLRELIRIPGESCGEAEVISRIKSEMERLDFDKIEIDPMGNILGYMGHGKALIAYDAHIDTVGTGTLSNWDFDPYGGFDSSDEIGGRGASDQLGGLVSAVYGAKLMKDLDLIPSGYAVLVTGTVQEEDCDGLCWQYIIDQDNIRPEFVVITEPTDGGIYRGQRGRMEIKIEARGLSCHGSAPERGDNAIYKMAEILLDIRRLNDHLRSDDFLGKGTVTASEIFFTSPSRCAVADSCSVSLDRRLTAGETYLSALDEIRQLPAVKKYGAEVSMYKYEKPSWTGLIYPTDCYFPTWVIPEDHTAALSMASAFEALYGKPRIDKWTFSTNGVSIMGRYGIPCIGFGPGKEAQAHASNERTWKNDLVRCAAVYSAVPGIYAKMKEV